MRKTFTSIGLILLGGLLPILAYLAQYGSLGVSEIASLQTLNAPEQLALTASLLTIKPIYLLLSVAILLTLWDKTALPARVLLWGFSALISGELICGAIFSALGRELIISEHVHSYGMMLEFASIAFALIYLIERRVAQTQIRPIFAFLALMGILASFLPLAVTPAPGGYHTDLYSVPYLYARFEFNQWVESRALPVATLCFFALALFAFLRSKPAFANICLAVGTGWLAFSFLRLSLGALFAERLVWFEFWEETTQFILISTISFLLWQVKRAWTQERLAVFERSG
ncbi:MAG: hypothetical protein IT310_11330 [Anaerolineales bacterium]|nr:hypothetical protein [Anaerolineales bacterium]